MSPVPIQHGNMPGVSWPSTSVPVTTTVYTDGACSGNPGPGGWAWVVPEGLFASGADSRTTNQRMELTAVLEALGTLDGPLDVVSDSTYVVNCFRDRWWEGWLERGWRTTKKKPVANRDLWEPLVDLVRSRGDIEFRWVKGHAGDRWNDLADRLATEAVRTRKPRSGDRPPTEIGEAEDADTPAAGDGDFPEGHRLVVAGHRPPEIGGYDPNPLADAVRRRLESGPSHSTDLLWEILPEDAVCHCCYTAAQPAAGSHVLNDRPAPPPGSTGPDRCPSVRRPNCGITRPPLCVASWSPGPGTASPHYA